MEAGSYDEEGNTVRPAPVAGRAIVVDATARPCQPGYREAMSGAASVRRVTCRAGGVRSGALLRPDRTRTGRTTSLRPRTDLHELRASVLVLGVPGWERSARRKASGRCTEAAARDGTAMQAAAAPEGAPAACGRGGVRTVDRPQRCPMRARSRVLSAALVAERRAQVLHRQDSVQGVRG
jgi:hypothetical protein